MRDLGRYVAHHALGRGGTATVYFGTLAGPSGFVRRVAIKELHAIIASDPQLQTMLTEEARISGRIMHPNTVPILDVVEHEGQAFAVMDYVHGATVFELLRAARARRGKGSWGSVFPLPAATAIGADVLSGLAAAHAAKDVSGKSLGVIHRDISPDNMLVGVDGVSRLTDFGIARAEGRAVKTESGVVKGKFRYMAPEQAAGEASQASDQFSMGVVLFELLTGDRLFDAEHEAGILNQVLAKPIVTVASVNPEVPQALSDVVARALARDPSRRFPSAAAMGEAWRAAAPRFDQERLQAFVTDLVGESLREKLALVEAAERAAEEAARGRPALPGAMSDRSEQSWEDASTVKDAPRTITLAMDSGGYPRAPSRPEAAEPTRMTFEAAPVQGRGPPMRVVAAVGVPLIGLLLVVVYAVARSGATHDDHGPAAGSVDRGTLGVSSVTIAPPPSQMPTAVASATPRSTPAVSNTGSTAGTASTVAIAPTSSTSTSAPTPPPKNTKPRPAEPDCRTPFFIDSQGVRVYRRECLQ